MIYRNVSCYSMYTLPWLTAGVVRGLKFYFQTNSTNHFYLLGKAFIRVCPKKRPSSIVKNLAKFHQPTPIRHTLPYTNFFCYFNQGRVFYPQHTSFRRQLIQVDLESRFIVKVSVRSRYLVRLLSQCCITYGHTIHQSNEGLLPLTSIEPTAFRNSASKVAGLQVHATTPGKRE